MAAVPIFVWNGTAWQETGPTIPANPIKYQASAPSSPATGDIWVDSDGDVTSGSTQLQRFRFVASGGETSLSGADANLAVLAYTAGFEQVVLNGAVLVRGHDYTATNGTSITGLSPALVANDVVEVFSFMAFNVANTYTQSQVDGLIAIANAQPGMKLIVPSSVTNGTATANGSVSFSAVSSVSLDGVFSSTYENYKIVLKAQTSTEANCAIRLRSAGSDDTGANYFYQNSGHADSTAFGGLNSSQIEWIQGAGGRRWHTMQADLFSPNIADNTFMLSVSGDRGTNAGINANNRVVTQNHWNTTSTQYTGISFVASSGTITGTVSIYGYKN